MARDHKSNTVNMAREMHRDDVLQQLATYRAQLAREKKSNAADTIMTVQLIQNLMFICEQRGYL